MKERKNIALFIAMIENEFSYAICEGALMGAKEIDANLYILPAGIIDAVYDDVDANCYRYQYNTLYSYLNSKSIDAIIIEYGTVTSFLDAQKKKQFLEQTGDIPVILLAGKQEGYSSICVDNRAGLQEIIVHMIEEHHCTKIGYVSGPTTSLDAIERLEVYKETMTSCGLPADEDWIVYGNFSEFSEEVVEDLIQRHPDIEVIVCANDQMAVGVYNVMKKMNLTPGKDILVSGFDDSPTAMVLEPHLTSVKADTKELAYMAVLECPNVIAGNIVNKSVKSRAVLRESTNCGNRKMAIRGEKFSLEELDSAMVKKLANDSFDMYFNNYFESNQTTQMKQIVENYFDYFLHLVNSDGELCIDYKELVAQYIKFGQTYNAGYIDLNLFLSMNYILYGYISNWISKEEDKLELLEIISMIDQEFMDSITKKIMVNDEKVKTFEIVLTSITRDMLQFSNSEHKKYNSVISKLRRMGFASSYIYLFDKAIINQKDKAVKKKDNFYLRACHNQEEVSLFDSKKMPINTKNVFMTELIPNDRRHDMLVMPLFSGEELYGMMLTESGVELFRYASQIACQVSVSIEVLELLRKQNNIKRELERNLAKMEESNRVLDAMSHSDPLTGIANRRGYLDMVTKILKDRRNYGKTAIAIYADMDNLKIVNDEFGHDEGDFALRTIAKALTESFRDSDVVARMGGDEFAAFAIVNHDNFADLLKERIHGILADMNENDKPFYVNMSIGTHEFIISEDVNLDHILNVADEDLYREKKNKKKVVYKN